MTHNCVLLQKNMQLKFNIKKTTHLHSLMANSLGKVYLIPTVLYQAQLQTIPNYVVDAIKNCSVFFVENAKTTRQYFKQVWKEMVIDDYEWFVIHQAEEAVLQQFANKLKEGKNIGIVSEAGCPGIADPGQILVQKAQQMGAEILPLVGPNSIILALMASGLNGQQFMFNGYLPIDAAARKTKLKQLENFSQQNHCTQIFIETPYRNNQMLADILATCKPQTQLCIGVDITAPTQQIVTKTVASWSKNVPNIHKKLCVFLIMG